jgi:hypothetical protein
MIQMSLSRSYSELIRFQTFEERFQYLKLGGLVGKATFGHDRYLNQLLYHSNEWRRFRKEIIIRDNGGDMALEDYQIVVGIIVHHIVPLTIEDIENRSYRIFDPENVVCVSHKTHEAIHYGDERLLPRLLVERRPNDTCPWK